MHHIPAWGFVLWLCRSFSWIFPVRSTWGFFNQDIFCLRKGCGAKFRRVKTPYDYEEVSFLRSAQRQHWCYDLGLGFFFPSQVSSLVQWYPLYTNTFLHVYIQGEMVPTSQESPVYWGGQEHCSTVFPGPPVPSRLVSSRPTSPMPSRWVWVKYRAWILSPTKSARAIISSSLETGLLLIAWRQFPCRSELCTSDLTWWACRWKRWAETFETFSSPLRAELCPGKAYQEGELGEPCESGSYRDPRSRWWDS